MSNAAPERIWLQLGAGDQGTHTWCDQNQGWDDDGPNEPEYIRADLAKPQWRDIATAPKDGTWVLGFGDGMGIVNCVYIMACDRDIWFETYSENSVTPKHWMPLPDGPEAME